MGDTEDHPKSPPLSKGAYNFNFDEFDDSMDPFKSKGGLSLSPPTAGGNPFQSKCKMGSSPPVHAMGSSPPVHAKSSVQDDAIETDVDDPFTSSSKLGESPPGDAAIPNDREMSEPINIDTDVSPFVTKSKVALSPPITDENPLQTQNKMSNSPPSDSGFSESVENPFETKTKMGISPPQSDSVLTQSDITNVEESSVQDNSTESFKTASESPVKSNKGLKTKAKSQTPPNAISDDSNQSVEKEPDTTAATTPP